MNYTALVSLAICSLATVLLAVCLPYITSDLLVPDRVRVPRWALAMAFVLLVLAMLGLRTSNPSGPQITRALFVSATLIGGIFLKWLLEVLAQKKFSIHETTLAQALLLAPASALILGIPANSAHVFFWFLCGFFWCAVLCDLGRFFTKEEEPIARRKEP